MKRLAIAFLLLPALSGCGFYGTYAVIRDEAVKTEEIAYRTLMASEIMWTEATYNSLLAEVAVRDPLANTDDAMIETISVSVTSSTDPMPKTIMLTETHRNSGVFRGSVALVRTFDMWTGDPLKPTAKQIAVNADQDAVTLEAVYQAQRGEVKALASYIEPPMLFGTALDADGLSPLPGATVLLSGGPEVRTTTARTDGTYAFYGLGSGTYTISVMQDGVPVGQSRVYNR